MARLSRLKFSDPEEGYYHVISRTVQQEFMLHEKEKEYFIKLLNKLSKVYFVRVATFAVLTNHWHLILQMKSSEQVSDEDLRRRFDLYYNDDVPKKQRRVFLEEDSDQLRKRFGDLSCFVQDLKQRFSRWYNREHKRHGHVWSERFKSVLLEGDRALLACMVYVELNAVRAGIVSSPEEYRYCGLHHYVAGAGGRISKWLDYGSLASVLPLVSEDTDHTSADVITRYLQIIYYEGMEHNGLVEGDAEYSIETGVYSRRSRRSRRSLGEDGPIRKRTTKTDSVDVGVLSFRRRIRYFSDGVILGSKTFCEDKFNEFRSYFQTKRDRTGQLIKRKYKDRRVSAPEDDLLHLHSIRSFVRMDQ